VVRGQLHAPGPRPIWTSAENLASTAIRSTDRTASGVPRNFVRGCSENSVEDRGQWELGSGGGSPLVRGSGGSCNLVQEISFQIVKFFNFWYFKTFYDDNQFICHCKCKTIANLGCFGILLPFFRISSGVGVLNSAIFKLIRMLE